MAGVQLTAAGLELRRGDRRVLAVDSLSVAPGEALGILGPNGAGKSTLLALLAGLEAPSAGQALIGGETATLLSARRRVSLLPQDAPMLAGTVTSNVERPLALRGVAGPERRRRALAALERVGMAALAKRSAATLSGGESRRVALARALVSEPDALLLDEPFNAVDEPTREALLAEVRAQVRDHGRTMVVVTQRRDEALRIASRLALLWEGRIAQEGHPQQVVNRPATPALARFLGKDNVLEGVIVDRDADGLISSVQGVRLHATAAHPMPPNGTRAWLVFGPESVELRAPGTVPIASPRNVMPARVVALSPRELGVEVHLDAGFPLVAAVTHAAVDELRLSPGAQVLAAVKATAIHVLPHS